ncbi:MAG: fructosamine kinase family protein [Phycisphaera sp.]|nr:MAG: fructosamine kinase family protein [Phycisphaera sp.]
MAELAQTISNALGTPVHGLAEMHGGCIARVVRGTAEGRGPFVAKIGDGTSDLTIESGMLADLGRKNVLPVPGVWHSSPDLLVMERLPGSTGVDAQAQRHLAELLAELHGLEGPAFGYERDTLIGPLTQPNGQEDSWARFFGRHRVLHFAGLAEQRGALPGGGLETARRLADAMEREPDRFTAPGERPALIHGDLWSGNMLSVGGRVTGLIDPAIYCADREIELAFMGLFGCVGKAFFDRYHELRPIAPDFFERRQGMYRIYPLLVHAVLFGGGYGRQAVGAMQRALGG